MNNIKYFIDLENNTNIKGQGDKFQAASVMDDVDIKIYKSGTKELITEGRVDRIITRYNAFNNIPLFCMTVIQSDGFKIKGETDESYKVTLDISKEDMNKILSDFGEKAVIINPVKFLNTIKEGFHKNGIEFVADKIKYVNFEVNDSNRLKSYANMSMESIYIKDQFFKYQREYRIALINISTSTYYIANIENLRNAIVTVMNTKDFFSNTNLEVLKSVDQLLIK